MTPVKYTYSVRDQRAGPDSRLPLLSVSAYRGVVPRSSLTDDLPRADDLSKYKLAATGDLIVNRMSAYQGALGRSPQPGLVSPDYLVLQPLNMFDSRYFAYLFRSTWFVGEISARVRGIGSIEQGNVRTPRINEEDLGRIAVAVPPVRIQQTIANYLDRETGHIDALIAAKHRMLELLEERRDAIIRNATRRGIRGAATQSVPISWIREAPSHWQVIQMKRIGRLKAGVAFPEEHQGLVDGPLPYFKVADLTLPGNEEYLQEASNSVTVDQARSLGAPVYPPGSVLFPKIGAALLTNRRRLTIRPSCSDQNLMCLIVERGVPRYYYYQLQSFDFGRLRMPGPVPLLNERDAADLYVLVPPDKEQREIVTHLDSLLPRLSALITLQGRAMEILRVRRRALITEAVMGALDIPWAVA